MTNKNIDSAQVGQQIPSLEVKLDLIKLMRYSAATWNFYLLHLEKEFAVASGSKDVNAHAPLFGALMATMLSDWTGMPAAIKQLRYSVKKMGYPGDTLRFNGKVTDTSSDTDGDWKVCELRVENQNGLMLAGGSAILGSKSPGPHLGQSDLNSADSARARHHAENDHESLLTPAVQGLIGQETFLPGRDVIDNSAILRYAQAVLDHSPEYLGPIAADEKLIAPPTFIFDVCHDMGAAIGEDGRELNRLTLPGLKAVRGGNEYLFFQAVVAGDRIDATRKIVDIYEKIGKSVGRILFVVYDTTYTNQAGALLGIARETMMFVKSL